MFQYCQWILVFSVFCNWFFGPEILAKIIEKSASNDTAIILRSCDTRYNCSAKEICFNGHCECQPDYRWNDEGSCEYHNCDLRPSICELQGRRCQSSLFFWHKQSCVCLEDQVDIDGICRQKCSSNDDCPDPNSFCNVFWCECRPNFRRIAPKGTCEPFECRFDAQCWSEGDSLFECRNGTCILADDSDEISQKLTKKWRSIFKLHYYQQSWAVAKILLLTIVIVPIVLFYCLWQNVSKAKSTLVVVLQPTLTTEDTKKKFFPPCKSLSEIMIEKEMFYKQNDCNITKQSFFKQSPGKPIFKYEKFAQKSLE